MFKISILPLRMNSRNILTFPFPQQVRVRFGRGLLDEIMVKLPLFNVAASPMKSLQDAVGVFLLSAYSSN